MKNKVFLKLNKMKQLPLAKALNTPAIFILIALIVPYGFWKAAAI